MHGPVAAGGRSRLDLPRVDRIPVARHGGRGDRSRARCAQIAVRRRAHARARLLPDPACDLDGGIGARPARGPDLAYRRPGRRASSSPTSTRCGTCRRTASPADGRPFESLDQLFDTYLAQTAPPPDGALVTYIGGQRYDQLVSEPTATGLEFAFDDVATGETPASGTIDSSLGEAQYIAVPVSGRR